MELVKGFKTWNTYILIIYLFLVFQVSCSVVSMAEIGLSGDGLPLEDKSLDLSNMILARDSDTVAVFDEALTVIKALNRQDTCQSKAVCELITFCKTAPKAKAVKNEILESVETSKSIYAIRLAICETRNDGARIPEPCRRFTSGARKSKSFFGWFGQEDDEKSSNDVQICVQSLQSQHYYWTSYSNNLQGANALCEASSHDSAQTRILDTYSDIADAVPALQDVFQSLKNDASTAVEEQKKFLRELKALNEGQSQAIIENYEASVATIQKIVETTGSKIGNLLTALNKSLDSSDDRMAALDKSLYSFASEFDSLMKTMVARMQVASAGQSELVEFREKQYQQVHGGVITALELIHHQHQEIAEVSDSLTEHLNDLSNNFAKVFSEIAAFQHKSLLSAQEQLWLQNKTIENSNAIQLFTEYHLRSIANASQNAEVLANKLQNIQGTFGNTINLLSFLGSINFRFFVGITILYLGLRRITSSILVDVTIGVLVLTHYIHHWLANQQSFDGDTTLSFSLFGVTNQALIMSGVCIFAAVVLCIWKLLRHIQGQSRSPVDRSIVIPMSTGVPDQSSAISGKDRLDLLQAQDSHPVGRPATNSTFTTVHSQSSDTDDTDNKDYEPGSDTGSDSSTIVSFSDDSIYLGLEEGRFRRERSAPF